MANVRLLRRRIKTAKNISQITRAMEMVAASKMRKAQEKTSAGKPYTEKLHVISQNLVGRIEKGQHPYLIAKEEGKTLLLLFSSDKGLCGSFNTNLFREFISFFKENIDLEIIAVGRKLAKAAARMEGSLVADFPFGTKTPTFEFVIPITNLIIDGYTSGKYKRVVCMYTHFATLSSQKPTILTLLPIQREELLKETVQPYLFEPGASELLTALMPHYLEMSLYQILLENYASEQAARMIAMHQASENAKDVIFELSLYYNKVRQEKITNELLDIVGGMQLQA